MPEFNQVIPDDSIPKFDPKKDYKDQIQVMALCSIVPIITCKKLIIKDVDLIIGYFYKYSLKAL